MLLVANKGVTYVTLGLNIFILLLYYGNAERYYSNDNKRYKRIILNSSPIKTLLRLLSLFLIITYYSLPHLIYSTILLFTYYYYDGAIDALPPLSTKKQRTLRKKEREERKARGIPNFDPLSSGNDLTTGSKTTKSQPSTTREDNSYNVDDEGAARGEILLSGELVTAANT